MLIFLHGENEFLSREKLNKIRKKFLEKNSSGSGLSSFDLEENKGIKISSIKESFGARGLFFKKQLIIIKNLISNTSNKNLVLEILNFLESLKGIAEDKDLVIVFWEKGKINERNNLFKFLIKKAKNQKFDYLTGLKLDQWIEFELEKRNDKIKISKEALEKLAVYTGGNLYVLENEIKKISNYKEEGVVGTEEIEMFVKEKINSNIFETIEALSSGNKKMALKLFHEQLQKGEDPLYLLMMYVYQFRNFLKVEEYYLEGETNPERLAKKTGIHPFVTKKILGQLSRFSLDKLKDIYKKLQIIDERIKTGKGDAKLELDRFIVEI